MGGAAAMGGGGKKPRGRVSSRPHGGDGGFGACRHEALRASARANGREAPVSKRDSADRATAGLVS